MNNLLITTCSGFYKLSIDTEQLTPIHQGSGAYYGITWSHDKIFVAARNSVDDYKLGNEQILIFNNNLSYVGSLPNVFENVGLHQIQYDALYDKLYVTLTLKNQIAYVVDNNITRISPNKNESGNDINHFNSLLLHNDRLFITAHNKGIKPSEVYEHDRKDGTLIKIHTMIDSLAAHNCGFINNKLCVCDSHCGQISNIYGHKLLNENHNVYTRGLSITDNHVVIGGSQKSDAKQRPKAHGYIYLYNKNFDLLKTLFLKNIGQVFDLRILDCVDYCHIIE